MDSQANADLKAQATAPEESRELCSALYYQMLLIRRMEERAAKAYSQGKIGGFCHLYIGQEAVAVGAMSNLEPQDHVIAAYREHGQYVARGGTAEGCLAELYGKSGGCSRGRGGSMHLYDAKKGFHGGWGIVGAHIPMAAGFAFASKYKKDRGVALCFFGEGAVNQGAWHEGLAIAALWQLPVVFICENNYYAMGTPLERTTSTPDTSVKALGYNMARDSFEGSDVLLVRRRVGEAVRRAREECLPTLIEVQTYRFRGHSMSDPAKYRTREEVEERKQRDPLNLLAKHMSERLGLAQAEIDAVERRVKDELDAAEKYADESPLPDPDTVEHYVYAEVDRQEGRE
jgi:pyruvate dehydrogenase E1 component alpha subunit